MTRKYLRHVWLVVCLPALLAGSIASTASGQTVPVTTITRGMIDAVGARNLKEVLVAYVPGMTSSQDQNEVNVAMRAVYSSSQQKFLILVNGHQLNFRSYATANPDFSIALDHIDRIEVSRGPQSSVYGDGALAAVVNLITVRGTDLQESRASVGVGAFGQVKVSGLYGAETRDGGDVLVWGTLYRSAGQTVDVPASASYSRVPGAGQAVLDGFRGPASHDTGLTISRGRFSLFAAHRFGKYVSPFSDGGPTGELYRYGDYDDAPNAGSPGVGIGATNLRATVRHAITPRVSLQAVGYLDRRELSAHLVADPSSRTHQLVQWSEWGAGGIARISGEYTSRVRTGRWSAGVQVDGFRVDDSVLMGGTGSLWSTVGPRGGLLELGSEAVYAGFGDVVVPLGGRWQLDAAARFDHKDRREGDDINRVSPSVRLAYARDSRASLAVSYAESFLDAPYWYRFNALPSYRGGRTLRPEYLRSFQMTPEVRFAGNVARMNLFVNQVRDGVWRNNGAGPAEPIYQNAGRLRTWGLEPELSRTTSRTQLTTVLTYQRVVEAKNADTVGPRVVNVPALTAAATASFNPWTGIARGVWVDVSGRYVGPQASPINLIAGNRPFFEPQHTVDAAFLVTAGIRANLRRLRVDAHAYNVFDVRYQQGGTVVHPYPQAGRSGLVTVTALF